MCIIWVDRFIGEKFVDNPEEEEPLASCESCYKGSSKLIKTLFRWEISNCSFCSFVSLSSLNDSDEFIAWDVLDLTLILTFLYSLLLFLVMLGSLLISKGCLLFISSQLNTHVTFLSPRESSVRNGTVTTQDVCGAPYCIASKNDRCQVKETLRQHLTPQVCQIVIPREAKGYSFELVHPSVRHALFIFCALIRLRDYATHNHETYTI